KVPVVIVGAGPAGLMLSHLLALGGIDNVVLENRSREHVLHRVRAGVLGQNTVDLRLESGVGSPPQREGLVHPGGEIPVDRAAHPMPLSDLTGGRASTVYGQQEVVKDLVDARLQAGGVVHFDVEDVSLAGIATDAPSVAFSRGGERVEIRCEYIAGCDGFHG